MRVHVLEKLHSRAFGLVGPVRHWLEASGSTLRVDGVPVEQPWEAPDASWQLQLPDEAPRHYRGALVVRAVGDEVAVVLVLPLERYVAEVVASETLPGTPEEALRAQAVVARSFLLAQGPRHREADVCDLAHCQVLRGRGLGQAHRAAAQAAAVATRGRVLVLPSGAVAETPFHAACGGHTGDPEEVFGSTATGAAAVEDTGCPPKAWEAVVPLGRFREALGPLLSPAARPVAPAELELLTGKGGYVLRVVGPEDGGERPRGRGGPHAGQGHGVGRGAERPLQLSPRGRHRPRPGRGPGARARAVPGGGGAARGPRGALPSHSRALLPPRHAPLKGALRRCGSPVTPSGKVRRHGAAWGSEFECNKPGRARRPGGGQKCVARKRDGRTASPQWPRKRRNAPCASTTMPPR